jgi:hypothetical protein
MSIHGIMDGSHIFLTPFAMSHAHSTAASLLAELCHKGIGAPLGPYDADQEMLAWRALRSSPPRHRPHSPHE